MTFFCLLRNLTEGFVFSHSYAFYYQKEKKNRQLSEDMDSDELLGTQHVYKSLINDAICFLLSSSSGKVIDDFHFFDPSER